MDNTLNTLCQNKPWKAFCISLTRCTERRERFQAWAASVGLTFSFWDAFDKQNLTEDLIKEKGVNVAGKLSLGATACRISHEQLWNHILTNEKTLPYVFILEDDAGFLEKKKEDFDQFIQDIIKSKEAWSILQFGFGTMTGTQMSLVRPVSPRIYRADFIDDAHCILYTRKALRDVYSLSQLPKFRTRPSDGIILAYVQRRLGPLLCPATSIIEQTDTISYINDNTL